MLTNMFNSVEGILLSVFGLAVIIVGIKIASTSKKANYAETAKTGFNLVFGVVIVAIGLGAIGFAKFGRQILTALGVI